MKKLSILLMFISGGICFNSYIYAGRELEGVDIISRSERGADESWKYTKHQTYQNMIKANEKERERIENLKETNPEEYEHIHEKEQETKTANEYMLENFGEKIKLDRVVYSEEGNDLWRNQGFKSSKTQLIIHHTADDLTQFNTTEKATDLVKKIYEFHALKRGRGDIGYNFIIGPQGEIFEGRSGGPGIVGAHATRNNVPSVGIALIGNFQIQQPTDKQIKSLTKLLTALAKKYMIAATGSSIYHKRINTYPFIQDIWLSNIVGHRHVGSTSCPGKFLEAKLPDISKQVQKNLNDMGVQTSPSTTAPTPKNQTGTSLRTQTLSRNYFVKENNTTIITPITISGTTVSCLSQDTSIIVNCTLNKENLILTVKKGKGLSSGRKNITIRTSQDALQLGVFFIRQEDLDRALNSLKTQYLKNKELPTPNTNTGKIETKLTLSDIKESFNQPVSVLLYEASTVLTGWNLQCGNCTITTDSQTLSHQGALTITHENNQFRLVINNQQLTTSEITVQSNDTVAITNYQRTSFLGIPWNTFRGSLIFKRDVVKLLDSSRSIVQPVVINKLPLRQYMQGIAETNDQEHFEKNKVIALLTKNYMLYYIDKKNSHPSIPSKASYNAVDDPRIFQKYVGAGFETVVKNRSKALDQTYDQVIMYKGFLPILPYFNCSAGFTRSAKEKRGWTDTPWLKGTLDIARCVDFNGHGVGLSGKGAQEMAVRGINHGTIIKYYYPGTELINLQK